jgi:hypothetical protein
MEDILGIQVVGDIQGTLAVEGRQQEELHKEVGHRRGQAGEDNPGKGCNQEVELRHSLVEGRQEQGLHKVLHREVSYLVAHRQGEEHHRDCLRRGLRNQVLLPEAVSAMLKDDDLY